MPKSSLPFSLTIRSNRDWVERYKIRFVKNVLKVKLISRILEIRFYFFTPSFIPSCPFFVETAFNRSVLRPSLSVIKLVIYTMENCQLSKWTLNIKSRFTRFVDIFIVIYYSLKINNQIPQSRITAMVNCFVCRFISEVEDRWYWIHRFYYQKIV